MIKAIIFDYFDVLVRDEYWHQVNNHAEQHGNGDKMAQLNTDVNSGAISWQQFCTIIAKQMDITAAEVDEKYHSLKLNKQLVMYAHELKNRGYKIALLSNAAQEYLRPILSSSGLDALFDVVAISTEIGAVKPQADAYITVVNLLQVKPSEAVMIDDIQHNVDGAVAAGLAGVLYQNFAQIKQENEALLAKT